MPNRKSQTPVQITLPSNNWRQPMPIVIKYPDFQVFTEIENSDLTSMPKVENANLAP
jgi:hypothetical protein